MDSGTGLGSALAGGWSRGGWLFPCWAGGKQESRCPCGWGRARESRATLEHLRKEPGTPGMWAALGRVRSDAPGRGFVLGGVFMEGFLLAAAIIGYLEF